MCVCLNRSCVRSFAGCADLNLAGRAVEEGLVSQVQWRSNDDFSPAIQWSAEFTRHVLVTVRLDGTSTEVVLKKYQVLGTVPSGKPPKSEPYRTVPCRTMQWKSAIRARTRHPPPRPTTNNKKKWKKVAFHDCMQRNRLIKALPFHKHLPVMKVCEHQVQRSHTFCRVYEFCLDKKMMTVQIMVIFCQLRLVSILSTLNQT